MSEDPKKAALDRLKAQRQREDELVAAAAKAQAAVVKATEALDAARADYDTAVVKLRDVMGLARTAEVLDESEGTVRRKKAPSSDRSEGAEEASSAA